MQEKLYVKKNGKFYELMTVEEQAEKMNVTPSYLRQLRFWGRLKGDYVFIKKGNYKIKYDEE